MHIAYISSNNKKDSLGYLLSVCLKHSSFVETNSKGIYIGLAFKEPLIVLDNLLREALPQRTDELIVGLGSSKLISRVAVEALKDNLKTPLKEVAIKVNKNSQGTVINVLSGKEEEFLAPLPLSFLGLTEKEQFQLFILGVKTIGDLKKIPINALVQKFGSAAYLWPELCRGKDYSPVLLADTSNQITQLENYPYGLTNKLALEYFVKQMSSSLSQKLIRKGQGCLALKLKVAVKNSNYTKERFLSNPIYEAEAIETNLLALLKELKLKDPILSIKVTVRDLKTVGYTQLSLFSEKVLTSKVDKASKVNLEKLIVNIRKRYNAPSLSFGKELGLNRREEVLRNWDPLRFKGGTGHV